MVIWSGSAIEDKFYQLVGEGASLSKIKEHFQGEIYDKDDIMALIDHLWERNQERRRERLRKYLQEASS